MHKQPNISHCLRCLLHNMDAATSSLILRVGVKIKTTDSDVQLVLGLTKMVCIEQNLLIAVHMILWRPHLAWEKYSEISMDYVVIAGLRSADFKVSDSWGQRNPSVIADQSMEAIKVAKKNSKVVLVLFADAYLLATKVAPARDNHSILPYLVDPSCIHEVNWARYVLNVMKEASKKVKQNLLDGKKHVSLDCCLIFLEVCILNLLCTVYPLFFSMHDVSLLTVVATNWSTTFVSCLLNNACLLSEEASFFLFLVRMSRLID
jgi:hypothetical protein